VDYLKGKFGAASNWFGGLRLPVRIAVPRNEELAAAALSTLAVGLAAGLAVGPGIGSGVFMPAITAPLAGAADSPPDSTVALPDLGAPAGGSGGGLVAATGESAPPPASTQPLAAVSPAPSAPPAPLDRPSGGGGGGNDGSSEEDGSLPLTATVVSTSVTGRSYAVVDGRGNLLSVFANRAPAVGERVRTRIAPLLNGTFLQAGDPKTLGQKQEVTIRGVVSYFDLSNGIAVISSRGASVALAGREALEAAGPAVRVAASAEAKISLVSEESRSSISRADMDSIEPAHLPQPRILEIDLNFYEGMAIELTGRLMEVDGNTRKALFAADSSGFLTETVEVTVPPEAPLGRLKVGNVYSVTLRQGSDGIYRVTGFSPAWTAKGANNPAEAYGEQGA